MDFSQAVSITITFRGGHDQVGSHYLQTTLAAWSVRDVPIKQVALVLQSIEIPVD
jgi:hypothetical protein